MNISIIGGGSWGTALAEVLSFNGHNVLVYDADKKVVNDINIRHRCRILDRKINLEIRATTNIELAMTFSHFQVLAIPTKVMREVCQQIKSFYLKETIFINASKGLEPKTFKRVSEVLSEELNNEFKGYVQLTGPSHAEEVIRYEPTLICVSSTNKDLADQVQLLFNNQHFFRVYTNYDLIGSELCGALKNVYAIASGVLTGLNFGDNAKAALISRALVEMEKLVTKMGGTTETVYGLCGMGDLIVTCFSHHSRNYNAGLMLAKTRNLDKALGNMKMVVEGAKTAIAAYDAKTFYNIDAPIIDAIYSVIYKKTDPKLAISKLFKREMKHE